MTNPPEDDVREAFTGRAGEPASPDEGQPFHDAGLAASFAAPSASSYSLDEADPAAPAQAPSAHPPPAPWPAAETEPLLFQSYLQPPVRRPVRTPHFGHLLLVTLLIGAALGILALALFIASHFHLFGWHLSPASATDLKFNLLSEAALYLFAFAFSLIVFPSIWHESYFAGLQWNSAVVRSRFLLLAGVAAACFGLAILDQALLPGPANAPIEKMMNTPAAAWLMFGFGITLAPFFEEMFFRGFLLPAWCTAFDWIAEQLKGTAPPPLDANGHPRWTMPAMILGSIAASLPFALLHVAQQGHSLGPFLLLILVSLILCAVRLVTRSLAASTVVHAIYNFLIFTVELIGTSGFRHFDKM